MLISIGDKTGNAMKVLGIAEYPFTVNELSTKFRNLVKENHPDVNNSTEAKGKTQKIISSYSLLKNLAISGVSNNEQIKAQKDFDEDTDIFNLYETCSRCDGKGKTRQWYPSVHCPACNFSYSSWFLDSITTKGKGYKTVKCNQCEKGIFTLINGRKVTCRRCKGKVFYKVKCRRCNGTGFLGEQTFKWSNCTECKGTGKVKLDLWNPVIPKGAVL